jgi:hypothetical protein
MHKLLVEVRKYFVLLELLRPELLLQLLDHLLEVRLRGE